MTAVWRFAVFVGPKDLKSLDLERGPNGTEVHLGEAIEFGWLAILCRPMLWLMQIFFSVFGNWGVAIILLTVVVKLLTLYWTQKSMRSMKEMQRLKPKMDELRERFKDDKERLNQELMSLYKVHKVNPLGGCLPMLIQMPIWFALYRTLGNAVELYRSDFIFWVKDLTSPDPYYILPLALGVAMYGQQAISPQPMEGTQAKVMKYFMPGMFTVMMIALPSGLTLYIFVNTLLTMVHQWYMNKTDPHRGDSGKGIAPKPKDFDRDAKEMQRDGQRIPAKNRHRGGRNRG
jgi:YidC/Oxa1 family membrane protein insertase